MNRQEQKSILLVEDDCGSADRRFSSSPKRADMENIIQINDQIRLTLLDRCFNLGLPASSKDDISTLKMYLDVDSKLDIIRFNFPVEKETTRDRGIKSLILKMFLL